MHKKGVGHVIRLREGGRVLSMLSRIKALISSIKCFTVFLVLKQTKVQ
jgi:hypothetical protein